jgi:hypothetical protein
MVKCATLVIQHAELGICHEVPIKDPERASPSLLLSYLERLGVLPVELPDRPYMVLAEGKRLVPHETFARQGVRDRSVLTVVTRGLGAADARPAPTHFATPERRVLDFRRSSS